MKFLLLPLILISFNCIAQDTTLNYRWMAKCVVVYSTKTGKQVYKSHKWDTLDFSNATRPIYIKGETLFCPAPISDSLIISSHNGDWYKDTVLSYGFKGGAVGFYYKGPQNSNGSVYDYFYISYPDARLPNGDIQVKSIQLIITKKQAAYSN